MVRNSRLRKRLIASHDDVTAVKLRLYDLNVGAQQILPMEKVAEDEDCYQSDLVYTCDFWAITLPQPFTTIAGTNASAINTLCSTHERNWPS